MDRVAEIAKFNQEYLSRMEEAGQPVRAEATDIQYLLETLRVQGVRMASLIQKLEDAGLEDDA